MGPKLEELWGVTTKSRTFQATDKSNGTTYTLVDESSSSRLLIDSESPRYHAPREDAPRPDTQNLVDGVRVTKGRRASPRHYHAARGNEVKWMPKHWRTTKTTQT